MVYGKLPFDRTVSHQLGDTRRPKTDHNGPIDVASSGVSSLSPNMPPLTATAAPPAVAGHSWTLLDDENGIDWTNDDACAPAIHIVSTVHALAESLLVSEGTDVFIAPGSSLEDAQSSPAPTPSRGVSLASDDSSLSVTLCARNHALNTTQQSMLWLPIDLNTLLTRVLVSPVASTRFVDVVAELVQRICRTTVCRPTFAFESAIASTG